MPNNRGGCTGVTIQWSKTDLNEECGLIIDLCVVCAKIMSFVQEVFYFLFHCNINEVLRLRQEV